MKNIFIILGNGFTIDFLNNYNKFMEKNKKEQVHINVQNLFQYGECINTPWNKKPGFLSYKTCPALWILGARSNQKLNESNNLIEEIISCANMFFDFINEPEQKSKRLRLMNSENNSIYIKAYCELIVYLRCLFSWYNSLINDISLKDFVLSYDKWGWLKFFKTISKMENINITFVTYNYDIWLERLLKCLNIDYKLYGFETGKQTIEIIKPHGSISFIPASFTPQYKINYNIKVEGTKLDNLKLEYNNLEKYTQGAIIPPAGDSSRLEITSPWASKLREEAVKKSKMLSNPKDNTAIMCGISYWHVDRKEIDELLINLNADIDLTFINPNPSKDLNAVLSSIFKNYVLQTTSDNIGDILNG